MTAADTAQRASRLDSFIRRLAAQRACLDWAVGAVAAIPGPVLELGLGNGRTYDHLRSRIGGTRHIYAFDRQLAAHPACVPPSDYLLLGDFNVTLPAFANLGIPPAALIHADTGTGDQAASAALARWLGPVIAPLLAPGGVVLSDQEMNISGWATIIPPPEVSPGRYFLYRNDLG